MAPTLGGSTDRQGSDLRQSHILRITIGRNAIEPDDVKARLASMGLTDEPLLHAARRWYLSWISFTANHPAFAIGIAAWMEAVAALREGLLPLGWVRSDERNYALVIHPDGSMAINIASGDAGTGIPTTNVSNRAPNRRNGNLRSVCLYASRVPEVH